MMTRPVSIFVEASKKIYKFFDIHVFAYYIFLSIQCVVNQIFFEAKTPLELIPMAAITMTFLEDSSNHSQKVQEKLNKLRIVA